MKRFPLSRLYNPAIAFFLVLFFFSCAEPEISASIVEFRINDNQNLKEELVKFCNRENIDLNSLYNWENHRVIYTDSRKAKQIRSKIEKEFPGVELKIYNAPFYEFNRKKNCNENPVPEWDNIIMTANLVADATQQNEYMEYHRKQLDEWPEVSRGFCNAGFQQLLVFRNGRQLMLVISIPKGENLEELNPKTTENNPRVDEWNGIMGKYQEGIEDAPEGITWIQFPQTEK